MDVRIEKLVYGGEGLGHSEGQTIFVPYVLPGEVVSVRPVEQKKKFARGRVEQVVTPSPERAAAPCPHFGVCGGCDYQHIPYPAQLRYKAEILRETLSRLGRVTWEGPITIHDSPAFGYRNRAQWKVLPNETDGRASIGYFQAGSSTLCAIQQCGILSPRLQETLATIMRLVSEDKLPASPGEIEAFADAADEKLLLNLAFAAIDGPLAPLADLVRGALPQVETILVQEHGRDRMELFGPGYLQYEVGGIAYRVGHLSFFQVNRHLVKDLVEGVVANYRGHLALDLYAGVGLFARPLAQLFERVIAVEANPATVRDLRTNLKQSRASAQFREGTTEGFLGKWKETPDLAVLDPPRAGVSPAALARLTQLTPRNMVYLSCDPATLARDLGVLAGGADSPRPYEIGEVHLFDIFPQTYHMEVLVRLRRRE